MKSLRFSLCLFLLVALAALAQSDRGSITGTIADPSGAVVASAKIEAKNIDTSAVYEAGSSTTGNYVLPQLPTGNYELTVTVTGFKKYVKQNIFLPVAQTLRVDVKLEVGTTSDTVTITEATPLLKTESGELSHNVTTDRINNLPVLQIGAGSGLRSPYAMTNLIPGSSYSPDALNLILHHHLDQPRTAAGHPGALRFADNLGELVTSVSEGQETIGRKAELL